MKEDDSNKVYEFPVSRAQAAFWMLNKMAPHNPAYNIPVVVQLQGAVNVEALFEAVNQTVERHEILRTRYLISAGHLVQQVFTDFEIQFDRRSFIESGERARLEIDKAISEKVAYEFDLSVGEMLRAGLLQQSADTSIFYLVVHHIAVDHAAVLQLANEIEVLYRANCQGVVAALPEPELQYVDYVMWSKETEVSLDAKVEAWKQRLSKYSGVLSLPLDRPRPSSPSGCGADYRFQLNTELSEQVRRFSREQKVSIFQVTFSGLVALLSRLSGQNDIVVGTPFTKRGELDELEKVVGNFINTLPIAVLVDGGMNFNALVKAAQAALLFAFEHQEVPFESIVSACAGQRHSAVNPLFQVGFVFQEPQADMQLNGLQCANVNVHNGGAMYDLHVWMWDKDGVIGGSITYDTDIYSALAIEKFSQNFQALLASLMDFPEMALGKLPLLSAAEMKALSQWNGTAKAQTLDQGLLNVFSNVAKKNPHKIALVADDSELTYADLDQRSNQLAVYLKQTGVLAGEFVGVCISRSSHLLVGLLGVLKAGAVYVPLDPEYPNERLLYMVEKSSVGLVVADSQSLTGLPDFKGKKICIDSEWSEIASVNDIALDPVALDALMYVIFTSGSTGQPKGVQISHACAANFLSAMAGRPGISESDRLLAVTTLSFDISVLELFLPLTVGATVVLANRDQVGDGSALLGLIQAQNISFMQATPSTWRLLIAAGWERQARLKALCGGEAFPRDLAAELLARASSVWNMYGPTETTVWSSCYQIEDAAKPIVIGSPIDNTQCYVLNNWLQPQPIGVAGELYIGGLGVAEGYLGRDDLTAERFIVNPFETYDSSEKLYRTGDVVRWRADGNLEYLNRIDNQVKVRGYRIELEEIEQALLRHEAVDSCVVVVSEFNEQDKRLVGYIKFVEGEPLTGSEVRRYLRTLLPEYMVLQHVVEVESLPLTLNGKIDRKSLPNPFESAGQETIFVEPANDIEGALARIWAAALGVERVSANSFFFELGGHSMLALEVQQKIEAELGVRLSTQNMLMDSLDKIAALIGTSSDLNKGGEQQERKVGFLEAVVNKIMK